MVAWYLTRSVTYYGVVVIHSKRLIIRKWVRFRKEKIEKVARLSGERSTTIKPIQMQKNKLSSGYTKTYIEISGLAHEKVSLASHGRKPGSAWYLVPCDGVFAASRRRVYPTEPT